MPDQAQRTGWAKLCAGLVIAAFEFVSDCLHPEITEILVIAGVTIPLIMMAALLAIITRSDEQTCERVFRLLRWTVNRPEPPGTQATAADSGGDNGDIRLLTGPPAPAARQGKA